MTSFLFPSPPPHSGDAYQRFTPRTEMDIAVVGVAVWLSLDEAGVCKAARVVLGAVAPTAILVKDAADALIGTRVDEAALDKVANAASAACRPIDDKRGTKDYRIKVAGVLAQARCPAGTRSREAKLMSKKIPVATTVNGDTYEFLCEPQQTLLDVLRNELQLSGTKEGCSTGDCGACSVVLDGRLVASCLVLAAEAEGKSIETIEGMAKGDQLHPLQRAFLEHNGVQCGFCTPGTLIAARALLGAQPGPDRIRSALLARRQPLPLHRIRQDRSLRAGGGQGNAGGPAMTTILEKSGYNPDKKLKVVGTNPVKHDGVDKVTGRAKFGADLFLPGMLVGKILRSPHPHAILKSIDASKAQALPGVKAVVTRDDFPEHAPGTPMGDLSRNVMAREKVFVRGPCGRRGRGDQRIHRQEGVETDRGRIRGAAARHRSDRGDASRMRPFCTIICGPRVLPGPKTSAPMW